MTMTKYIFMGKSAPGPKEHCKQIVSLCWAWLLTQETKLHFAQKY